MRFLNTTTSQIEKICPKDDSRFSMLNVLFVAERGHLVATNGHCLAIVQVVAEEGDVTGWITPEALAAWRAAVKGIPKYSPKTLVHFTAAKDKLIVRNHHGNEQNFVRPRFDGSKSFPDYDRVFPNDYSDKPAFTLDIELLYKLVQALGHTETVTGKSSMVAVFPSKDNKGPHLVKTCKDGPLGIIMPVRADGEKDNWLTTIKAVDKHFAKQVKEKEKVAKKSKEATKVAVAKAEAKSEPVGQPTPKQIEAFEGDRYETEDGVQFYQYEDGSLGDHPDIDKADLMYDSLEELKENIPVHQVGADRRPPVEIGKGIHAVPGETEAKESVA
jgi:hypothetical protein